jgi:hypothetical protein
MIRRDESMDWMPNSGVGWTAKVLQADEHNLGRGGSLLPTMQSTHMAQASLNMNRGSSGTATMKKSL